ncbi:potassium transporter Kup [Zhengella mangrovi]|uniref:Probable potassium transport system protein Kup n=1 Tax=Zhengella mangrovi TaxID=1982044 RepID=A0A2G1QPS5_9HYPH|nr:potassium transporter Kup [Zhengella mangrovi]PHP67536.1 potassium transporter Kup [Zhengella mangrovi]
MTNANATSNPSETGGETNAGEAGHHSGSTVALALGAIGVVYGDIGTSPIYALRETVRAAAGDALPTRTEIIGALSIIIWALTIVVTIKYALLVLRADNKGEGGTLSIMALASRVMRKRRWVILLLGTAGASLFFGDAVITPAISVLSAVEGLEVAAPAISHVVIPVTAAILVTLFMIQRFGTGKVSTVFGPLTLVWFLVLGISGAVHVVDDLSVFRALSPVAAIHFVINHSNVAFAVIGAAFLAVTGAEALYVDLGHFGRKPILLAWFLVIFPCLLLNYFGQAAWLLHSGAAVDQPLFQMMPEMFLIPMVILATMATVIASQAVISGAFSLTRQAVQLNILPRFEIVHTSAEQSGQIYLPQLNWMLLAGVLLLVFGFGSSERLASAYGISVTGEMLVTTLLLAIVMLAGWKWKKLVVAAVIAPFFLVDVTFLSANLMKIPEGGWVSVAIALVVFLLIRTWMDGRAVLFRLTRKSEMSLPKLVESLVRSDKQFVPGTAVFLTSDSETAPTSLLHSLKHYKVLHELNIVLTVETESQPVVPDDERVAIKRYNDWLFLVTVRYGFMEDPNIPKALATCRDKGLVYNPMETSYFLSRRSLIASRKVGMAVWRDRLFIAMARNAADASSFFRLPTGRVVEIGTQIEV